MVTYHKKELICLKAPQEFLSISLQQITWVELWIFHVIFFFLQAVLEIQSLQYTSG